MKLKKNKRRQGKEEKRDIFKQIKARKRGIAYKMEKS